MADGTEMAASFLVDLALTSLYRFSLQGEVVQILTVIRHVGGLSPLGFRSTV